MWLSSNFQFLRQSIGALVAGILLGSWLGSFDLTVLLAQAVWGTCEVAGNIALACLQALAVPLVLSSVVLGGAGLEAMRATPRLLGKASGWMLGTGVLAVVVACGVAWCAGPTSAAVHHDFGRVSVGQPASDAATWAWGWVGLVFVSLGLGYYRNQLDEGHGKLFSRFCQSLEGMVNPLLRSAQLIAVIAIFMLVLSATARSTAFWLHETSMLVLLRDPGLLVVLTTGAVYLGVLSLVVWVKTRIGPHRYAPALVPAMLLAATGLSVEAALPFTMDAMRRRTGVSNRVASAVLPLGAALHRDGVALLWTAATLVLSHPHAGPQGWMPALATGVFAWTLACGGNALNGPRGMSSILLVQAIGGGGSPGFALILAWIVVSLGNAISVFSHACAALIIARGEGEYWVPGPPPPAEEIQGLKTDLALADS